MKFDKCNTCVERDKQQFGNFICDECYFYCNYVKDEEHIYKEYSEKELLRKILIKLEELVDEKEKH